MALREEISVRGPDGRVESWSVIRRFTESEWHVELSDDRGRLWEGVGEDLFEVFRGLRREAEAEGHLFLVAGARLDCWPSGMQGQMSAGALLSVHLGPWRMVTRNLLAFVLPSSRRKAFYRDVFSSAPVSKVGTVEEQEVYRERWIGMALR